MAEDSERGGRRELRPDPDPSTLTSDALHREVAALKEQLQREFAGEIKVVGARIEGIEKAIEKANEDYTRVPTSLQEAVGNLRALHEVKFELHLVKFEAVQTQLQERDEKVSEVALATRTAVDAALAAAEKARTSQAEAADKATAKSEVAFGKAQDQQRELSQTEIKALRDIYGTLDRRVTVIEGQALGQIGAKGDQHSMTATLIAVIVAVISFVGLLITLLRPLAAH
jgi:hypothetical protein